jgi:hypothetical protein
MSEEPNINVEIEPPQEKQKIIISAPNVCRFCLANNQYHRLFNIFEDQDLPDLPMEIFEALSISVSLMRCI